MLDLNDHSNQWRSLGEWTNADALHEARHRKFPEGATEWKDEPSRRCFLKLMGASLALAGATACKPQARELIVPYVEPPENVVPGKPLFFATAFRFGGYAQGILVESHIGRPTKIEGNPDHPASLGATSAFAQASVLDLYDPDRSQMPLQGGTVGTWEAFMARLGERLEGLRSRQGEGLRLLTETVTSPTLAAQIDALLHQYPRARWHQYDPAAAHHTREGLRRALGRHANPVYHLEEADVILSLDSDVLFAYPGSLRYAHAFAERRRVREGETAMNRLYAVESSPTITGAMADHRLPLRPSYLEQFVNRLAAALDLNAEPIYAESPPFVEDAWLAGLVRDLQTHRGRSLIVPGEPLPPQAHVLVHRMNEALGNVGATVDYIDPVEAEPIDHIASLRTLLEDMQAGQVDTLVILGGNPAYTAPADLPFADALSRLPFSIHLSRYVDETSALTTWHLPQTHDLEAWSDARAYDGTTTIIQPLIAPLYAPCRSEHEVLAALLGDPRPGYDIVRSYWQGRVEGDFAAFWQQTLRDGGVQLGDRGSWTVSSYSESRGREAGRERAGISQEAARSTLPDPPSTNPTPAQGNPATDEASTLEIVFRPDPTVWDGRFANNGWLQELPKPITKLVWDNAALMSLATAARFGLENEQVVELSFEGRTVRAPVWIVPGHADATITVHLGYGRERAGRAGSGAGFNAYRLRTTQHPWTGRGLAIRPLDARYSLATTQHHHGMEGRHLVEEAEIESFRQNPGFVHEGKPIELPTLYPEYEYPGYKWGMVIDLNTCIGCNACITACQAENNIPIVGKDEVRRGREMHWLRVDRYYKGDPSNPDTYFQPVPCMHCEKAPCEVVCPTYATVHDHEGLNLMVYNRCIGTRYCSNNCPYKVRRFNFLQYADWDAEVSKLQHNPDVTVRERGVMEKCTYCIQRISAARIRAKKEDRTIRDGEVMTACQIACPTHAITFGDLNDAGSEVHHWHAQPHNYKLLHELNTQPRTSYLVHFSNPNPDVPKPARRGPEIGQEEQLEVEVGSERDKVEG